MGIVKRLFVNRIRLLQGPTLQTNTLGERFAPLLNRELKLQFFDTTAWRFPPGGSNGAKMQLMLNPNRT